MYMCLLPIYRVLYPISTRSTQRFCPSWTVSQLYRIQYIPHVCTYYIMCVRALQAT